MSASENGVQHRLHATVAYSAICVIYGIMTYIMAMHLYNIEAPSDYRIHAEWIRDLWVEGDLSTFIQRIPYCGWHAVVRLGLLAGLPYDCASSLVTALFNCLTAAICIWYFNRILKDKVNAALIGLIAFVALMVTAIYIPWFNQSVYLGQGSPNIWHSPTYDAIRPISLLTVILFADAICGRRLPMPRIAVLMILVVLGILLKPSFFAVFFPAVVCYAVLDMLWNRNVVFPTKMLCAVLIPAVIAFVMFIRLFFSGNVDGGSGIELDFFFNPYSPNPIISYLLLLAFVLYVMIVCRKRIFARNSQYVFVVLLLVVGICESAFITESGPYKDACNFSWGYMNAAFIAWIFFLSLFVRQVRESNLTRMTVGIGTALVSAHFISGVYYFFWLLFVSSGQC